MTLNDRTALRLITALGAAAAFACLAACATRPGGGTLRIALSFPESSGLAEADGRMLVVLASGDRQEPRFQVSDSDRTQQIFGVDVDGLEARTGCACSTATVFGYPVAQPRRRAAWRVLGPGAAARVPDVQAQRRPHGEAAAGSRGGPAVAAAHRAICTARRARIRIDPASDTVVRISLDKKIPPLPDLPETKYVKRIRIQSDRLTKFWGRPMYLGRRSRAAGRMGQPSERAVPARDLPRPLPARGVPVARDAARPEAAAGRPEGHRQYCPNGHEGEFCTKYGYDRVLQEYGYSLYKQWTGPGFPRVIMVNIQHANPYYDDSYAVNSENLGPYGDAITYELIPYIEKTFRGLGPWARGALRRLDRRLGGARRAGVLSGRVQRHVRQLSRTRSTSGGSPTSTSTRTRTRTSSRDPGGGRRGPGTATTSARRCSTIEQMNLRELVLGTKSRSGGQWDIWEAVFSPVGADGYPQRIWDKRTGVIDPKVAAYWRDHYDLVHIMERDWATLGPKLRGKIALNVGLSDNVFLNNAVYLAEEFLKSASNPPADATVDYGPRDEHCWSGDHDHPNAISRLTYSNRFIPAHGGALAEDGAARRRHEELEVLIGCVGCPRPRRCACSSVCS